MLVNLPNPCILGMMYINPLILLPSQVARIQGNAAFKERMKGKTTLLMNNVDLNQAMHAALGHKAATDPQLLIGSGSSGVVYGGSRKRRWHLKPMLTIPSASPPSPSTTLSDTTTTHSCRRDDMDEEDEEWESPSADRYGQRKKGARSSRDVICQAMTCAAQTGADAAQRIASDDRALMPADGPPHVLNSRCHRDSRGGHVGNVVGEQVRVGGVP